MITSTSTTARVKFSHPSLRSQRRLRSCRSSSRIPYRTEFPALRSGLCFFAGSCAYPAHRFRGLPHYPALGRGISQYRITEHGPGTVCRCLRCAHQKTKRRVPAGNQVRERCGGRGSTHWCSGVGHDSLYCSVAVPACPCSTKVGTVKNTAHYTCYPLFTFSE